jgi:hypothetical protein
LASTYGDIFLNGGNKRKDGDSSKKLWRRSKKGRCLVFVVHSEGGRRCGSSLTTGNPLYVLLAISRYSSIVNLHYFLGYGADGGIYELSAERRGRRAEGENKGVLFSETPLFPLRKYEGSFVQKIKIPPRRCCSAREEDPAARRRPSRPRR